ncbi:aminotransferase class I/II-fold pyridoxal phosphate-dependent enzyme [Clostridium sp. JN-1]|uniref:pyridoxal phosphate-dependent aminotransferase n=1 Tax=Clostridium sp. JN-1 TaxID=2483110 RepID=UPI000F0BD91E|nr:aminotransferase class I/II-fold pyridoxal phosphate-dependent enzyme [Clostridium sp. JN-1]
MNNDFLSQKVNAIEISGIRKFFNKVSKYPGSISLTLGQPDFNVPDKIKKAMIDAINDNKTTYTANAGIIELRKEISKYLKTMGIEYDTEDVCLTVGGSEGLMSVFSALINPNDKILIPNPAYPAYESCITLLGGKILNYKFNEDYSIDFDYLEKLIKKENPKIMVLCYPCNPTGAVLSKEDRDKLHKIIKENNIVVISDEIYSALCFEEEYYSLAQFDDIKDRVIVVSGFSKMFSMTGLRIGYVCAKPELMNGILKVHAYNVSCTSSIAQWGAYEGLKNCLNDVEYMKQEFIKRRDFVYAELVNMGFETNLPKGAFYIFPSIKKFSSSSEEFCEKLLKEARAAVVPGSAFGSEGEGHIRISYAYSIEELKEALDRIRKAL